MRIIFSLRFANYKHHIDIMKCPIFNHHHIACIVWNSNPKWVNGTDIIHVTHGERGKAQHSASGPAHGIKHNIHCQWNPEAFPGKTLRWKTHRNAMPWTVDKCDAQKLWSLPRDLITTIHAHNQGATGSIPMSDIELSSVCSNKVRIWRYFSSCANVHWELSMMLLNHGITCYIVNNNIDMFLINMHNTHQILSQR